MNTILTDDERTEIFRRSFKLIDSRPVGAQIEFIKAIEAAVLAKLREQEPPPRFFYDEEDGLLFAPEESRPDGAIPLYTQQPAPLPAVVQVPHGWKLVPVEPTRSMMAAAVIYANGNAVYKNVAAEALEIEESIYGEAYAAMLAAAPEAPAQPIDMILHCPACCMQHIDAPDERTPDWKNEPHRSHLCHGCGHIWRPADVPTNGVAAIKTKGKADSPAPEAPAQTSVPAPWREAVKDMRWRPIETAPRDGTNILLRWGSDGVSQGHYIPGIPRPWKFIDTNNGITWLINHSIDGPGGPSHWMPMPPAAIALADSLEGGE